MGKLAAFRLGHKKDEPQAKDDLGLHWDRDTLAFYGDPAWDARLCPRDLPFDQKLIVDKDVYTFEICAAQDCKPGKPPAMLLPYRIRISKSRKARNSSRW